MHKRFHLVEDQLLFMVCPQDHKMLDIEANAFLQQFAAYTLKLRLA